MDIIFDIGGTTTRIAEVNNKHFLKPLVFSTEKQYKRGFEKFAAKITEVAAGRNVTRIVGGIPGIFDTKKGVLLGSPNLPDYIGKPLQKDLSRKFSAEVSMHNDAAMAGLGEVAYGSARQAKIVAYLTVSTGVGGKRFVRGAIDSEELAFEPGKQLILYENKATFLEDLISGKALEKEFRKRPSEIVDPKVWDREARLLSLGLHNIVVLWRPDLVVLGGGVVLTTKFSLSKVETYLKKYYTGKLPLPKLVTAKLADFSGLYGALATILKAS